MDSLGAAAGVDGEVVEVMVVVHEDGGDRFNLVATGGGVISEDLVAGFEAGDGDGLAAGEQNTGAGREDSPTPHARPKRSASALTSVSIPASRGAL